MNEQIVINVAQAKKEEVLQNMIEAHRLMGIEEGTDPKKYAYLSKVLLRLIEKVLKNRNEAISIDDGHRGDDPPDHLDDFNCDHVR